MNYDIQLSLSETLHIKVLDTHTFDIYDRTFTKIEDITNFDGLTLTQAYNIIKSIFNKKPSNIVANIKKTDEKLCINMTYKMLGEFDVTFDILIRLELDKHTIDNTEKRCGQLSYEINNLKILMNNMEKKCDQLLHENINYKIKMTDLTNKINRARMHIGCDIFLPYNIQKIMICMIDGPNTVTKYNHTNNVIYVTQYGASFCFDDINIEEITFNGSGNCIVSLNAPTMKKICYNTLRCLHSEHSAHILKGSFPNLEELSIIDCPNVRTIKDLLPKKKIKITLEHISLALAREIPILKELGHTVEHK